MLPAYNTDGELNITTLFLQLKNQQEPNQRIKEAPLATTWNPMNWISLSIHSVAERVLNGNLWPTEAPLQRLTVTLPAAERSRILLLLLLQIGLSRAICLKLGNRERRGEREGLAGSAGGGNADVACERWGWWGQRQSGNSSLPRRWAGRWRGSRAGGQWAGRLRWWARCMIACDRLVLNGWPAFWLFIIL